MVKVESGVTFHALLHAIGWTGLAGVADAIGASTFLFFAAVGVNIEVESVVARCAFVGIWEVFWTVGSGHSDTVGARALSKFALPTESGVFVFQEDLVKSPTTVYYTTLCDKVGHRDICSCWVFGGHMTHTWSKSGNRPTVAKSSCEFAFGRVKVVPGVTTDATSFSVSWTLFTGSGFSGWTSAFVDFAG